MKTAVILDETEIGQAAIDYVANRTKGGEMKNPQAKLMMAVPEEDEEPNREFVDYVCEVTFEES